MNIPRGSERVVNQLILESTTRIRSECTFTTRSLCRRTIEPKIKQHFGRTIPIANKQLFSTMSTKIVLLLALKRQISFNRVLSSHRHLCRCLFKDFLPIVFIIIVLEYLDTIASKILISISLKNFHHNFQIKHIFSKYLISISRYF